MDNNHNDFTGNQLIQDDEAKFFLAAVINTLQDSVVTINLSGIITSWNQSAESLYGYPAREAIGRSLQLVTFPEEFSALQTKIERIRRGEQMALYDTIRLHKGGRHIHIEVTLSPVKNNKGEVIGVSTLARDVTELRKVQDALFASESHLRAIVEAAIDFAIITLDQHGWITDWNSGAEIMFGHSRNEAIGRHIDVIFTPEDRHASIAQVEIDMARATGRSIDERWHLHKDGTRFYMSGVTTPIDPGGISGYVKVARNITDRKLAEEALLLSEQRKSLAVQSAEMGEWEWNKDTNQIKISDQAIILLGLPSGKTLINPDALFQQIYPGDEQLVRQQVLDALGGLNIFQAECRMIRADNQQVKWINAYGRVVAHTNSSATKMIGVVYDITPRKILEKQKDDFISLASHELKTPVTAIRVFSELLQENLEESQSKRNVQLLVKLNEQVNRLIKLIQNLLDSSSLSEGRMKLYPETFDLNAVITAQMDAFEAIAPRHRLTWSPGPAALVHADRERIIQVITNFISNAVKYSPEQTEIIISTVDQGDKVRFSVADKGIGIPPEEQRFVFDRYYRSNQADAHKGFGLGLYISAEIIKQHHGTIGILSKSGEGSTFYFTLPYS